MSRRQSDCESSEEALFLPHEKGATKEPPIPRRKSRSIFMYLVHLLFLAINAVWSMANSSYKCDDYSSQARGNIYEASDAPYSERVTQYNLTLGEKPPFTTFDTAVADEAWASISMKAGLGWLDVPQEKVDLMEQPSVEFHDGAGYLFGVDVFHQLHCLNYLRKKSILYNHLYPSENEIENEQVPPEFHIPHCIDSIRLSLQCHADMSLVPQRWADGWLEPWAVWTNKHKCRNFDAMRDWALDNAARTAGRLWHPELGKVVSGRLNLTALPIWEEEHDIDVVVGHMPVCNVPQ